MGHPLRLTSLIAAVALLPAGFGAAQAQNLAPEQIEQLKFRHIGPVGNRVSAVAGVAGDDQTYYAGAASGGVWKTTDAGLSWKPIFDDQDVHSIGALAVAPSDPNVVWVGTGESFIRSNISIGNGVYRSTDGGENWRRVGLEKSGRVSRIVVHPKDPDVAYAAVVGHAYAPQPERGIYRTRNGGADWEQILFVDENTGASDLVMDPNNPRILLAGMWQLEIKTWGRVSGGPGSAIYRSRDGGDTWDKLEGKGLPKPPLGKIALCMTPSDSSRVYALIETGDGAPFNGEETDNGELWRSDDGGSSWKLTSHNRDLAGRSPYYSRCAVSPDDPDEVYFSAAAYSVTKDGGKSAEARPFGQAPGWDHHDLWIDPTDAARMISGHDGGLSISTNRGRSWFRVQLPIAQLYHVTVDNLVPYNVYGNRQDGPSVRGPSNSRLGGDFGIAGIPRGMWHSVGGGESGFATPDPVDPNVIWSSTSGYGPVGGIVTRYDERTRHYRNVEVWPDAPTGWPAADLKYRFQWTFPVLISPHDNETVYVTSQYVHRTTNRGQSWEVISPDLTTNDKTKQTVSGGLTPDNIGVEYCCVIYAFEESPVQMGVFWAGSNDGLVHVSRDGGENWTNVTANIPDLPPLGTVRNIDASRWDAAKAYLTVDFHQVGDFRPFVYKTEDFGQSWTKITEGIADSPLSYARQVREDPVRPGLLYLGTENALYVSFDDGTQWQSLQTNQPPAPMYGIAVQEHFNDLVIATYGRGFWILDDVTPLQQLTAEVADQAAHLFRPRDAYRFQPITEPMVMFDDPSRGENPPYGASLNFWLAETPEDEVKILIEDSAGNTVRTLEVKEPKSGLNRVWWDLRRQENPKLELRMPPLYADWVPFNDKGLREFEMELPAILAAPGEYKVHLTVGDEQFSEDLRVLKDPHSAGSLEDIQAQTELLREIGEDWSSTVAAVNRIEWIRRQLADRKRLLDGRDDVGELVETAESLEEKLVSIEGKLIQLKVTGTGQDMIRWPSRVVWKLSWLAQGVGVGDFPPTDQARKVREELRGKLEEARAELDHLLATDMASFLNQLREHRLGGIVTEFP